MSKERYNQIIDEVHKNYVNETMFDSNPKWLEPVPVQNMKTGEISMGARQYAKLDFIHKCKTNKEFSEKWGLKIEERELSLDEKLPKKINLKGYADEMEFSLTDKREIKFYGITKESNESLERVEKLKDNEVFYETDFGWGVFLNTDTFETISYDGTEWSGQKINIQAKQITLSYQNETIQFYE
jgi:hypothetical protein